MNEQFGRDSVSTGMTMENLIISVIFISVSIAVAQPLWIDLSVASLQEEQRLVQRNSFRAVLSLSLLQYSHL